MLLVLSLILYLVKAEDKPPAPPCTVKTEINEAIGPATLDYLQRALSFTQEKKCGSILMLINTPGGNLYTTRLIVEKIINSPVPFLCLVYPSGGGHAGSAGAIILQACHVAGAMPVTNLGAATPVSGGGDTMPADLRKKIVNDTTSWLDGITNRRGRNQKFGRDIVTEAKAVSAEEALKINAIDVVPKTTQEFLQFANGRTVRMEGESQQAVQTGEVLNYEKDLRHLVLSWIADPEYAYLLLMLAIALLYYEITHVGLIAPGVIGGICLVLSLIALHKMDVQWGGLALIGLGAVFLFLEIILPSFGILGIGGIVSFVLGSLFLFKEETGFTVPLALIISTVAVFGGIMLALGYMAAKTLRLKHSTGSRGFEGKTARVVRLSEPSLRKGQVEVSGELWNFECETDLKIDQEVVVFAMDQLTLKVKAKL